MRKIAVWAISLSAAAPAFAAAPQPAPAEPFEQAFATWRSPDEAAAPREPAVVVAKAGDALGRPIDFARVSAPALARGRLAPAGGIVSLPTARPLAASVLTSGFGQRRHPVLGGLRAHLGLDLAAPTGSPVVATSDGMVSAADWNGGYGLYVAVEHGSGVQTRYGHLSRLNVASGQQVRRGQVIGFVGSTGRSTGPHLHYEVRMNGRAINPALLSAGR